MPSFENSLAELRGKLDAALAVISRHPEVVAEVAQAMADYTEPDPGKGVIDARLNALTATFDQVAETLRDTSAS